MTNELAIRILTGDVLGTSEQTQEAVTMAVKALSQPDVPDTNVGDTISRQAAIDAVCSVCGNDCDKSEFVYNAPQDEQVIMCPEHYCLCTLPSAQPLTAYVISDEDGNIKCSNCGSFECWGNYCMNCGAKMRGKNNG